MYSIIHHRVERKVFIMQAVNKETAQPKSGMHRWEWGITIGIFVIGITTLLTLAGPSIARFFS